MERRSVVAGRLADARGRTSQEGRDVGTETHDAAVVVVAVAHRLDAAHRTFRTLGAVGPFGTSGALDRLGRRGRSRRARLAFAARLALARGALLDGLGGFGRDGLDLGRRLGGDLLGATASATTRRAR